MNDCCEVHPLISAYLDGELDVRERAMVQRHLGRCATCRQALADWEQVDLLLGTSAIAVTDKQLERFRSAIRIDRESRSFHRIGGLAAAAVLLLALALVWGSRVRQVDAQVVAEPFVKLQRIQRAQDLTQTSTLQAFEWELRTLKLELESSDLAENQREALSSRIEALLRRLQQLQHDSYEQGT